MGKIIGALLGFMLARQVGALLGFILGHLFDVEMERKKGQATGGALSIQESFFRTTFEVMGHVAKSDGRVSEEEVRAARAVMSDFRLNEADISRAIGFFTRGKSSAYPLESTLQQLREQCGPRTDLCRMFVQIQLQVALVAGALNGASRTLLARIAVALGLSQYELAHMEALLRMRTRQSEPRNANAPDRLSDAYEILGVAGNANDAEVTKAYRRLMNQNHPDKLVAKGLPESMMKIAEEKTRQIRAAYELIREARGTR